MASSSWVVVLDDDPVSQEQLRVCHAMKPPQLDGVVLCSHPENKEICEAVEYFPAFCRGSECVYGLRDTTADFAALTPAAPKPHTMPPAPPPPPREPS